MIVITAGNKYIDIDAYASGIAYAKLLNALGQEAIFASSATTNSSVCSIITDLGFEVVANYQPKKDDKFVLVDLSNPDFFDKIVNKNNIIEIIDHHTGFEKYWADKNIDNNIEFIGSVATLIYEKFCEHKKINLLDSNLCKLLIAAILDNTLNLHSDITTQRDIDAYNTLQKIGNLTNNFDREYFECCQNQINANVLKSIKDDIKIEFVSDKLPKIFGQLTVYNIEPILEKQRDIENLFSSMESEWLLNLICIKDGKSYILSSDILSQNKLSKLFNNTFENNILTLPKFKLRKEIMKMARSESKLENNK